MHVCDLSTARLEGVMLGKVIHPHAVAKIRTFERHASHSQGQPGGLLDFVL